MNLCEKSQSAAFKLWCFSIFSIRILSVKQMTTEFFKDYENSIEKSSSADNKYLDSG